MRAFHLVHRFVQNACLYALILCFTVLCALMVFMYVAPQFSYAAPSSNSTGNSKDLDVGTLSDRYDSLNNLENSLNEEESVVIDTRVAVLISVNRALDGSEVRFTGEVVGDVVNADPGYKWVNIMGTANNVIGVRMSDEQAVLIQNRGSYHATGTTLQITGTYHIACPEHQGELDVHASNVVLKDNGGPVTHLVSVQKLLIAVTLCVLAALLILIFLLLRRRMERRQES